MAYETEKNKGAEHVVVSEVVPGQAKPVQDVWGDLEGGVNYRGLGWWVGSGAVLTTGSGRPSC